MVNEVECKSCDYLRQLLVKVPENTVIFNYYLSLCTTCHIQTLLNNKEISQDIKTTSCCDKPELIELDFLVCANCGTVKDTLVTDNILGNFNDSACKTIHSSYDSSGMKTYGLATSIQGTKLHRLHNHTQHVTHKQKIVQELYSQLSNFELQGITEKFINQAIQNFIVVTNLDNYHIKDSKRNIFKGQRRKGMIAVCLWLSFEMFNISRSIEDICNLLEITTKCFFKELQRYNKLRNTKFNPEFTFETIKNTYFIKLNIDYNIQKFLFYFIDNINEQNLLLVKPKTLIASVCFWVLEHMNFTEIAYQIPKKFNISMLTIKKNLDTLNRCEQMLFSTVKQTFIMNRYKRIKRFK